MEYIGEAGKKLKISIVLLFKVSSGNNSAFSKMAQALNSKLLGP